MGDHEKEDDDELQDEADRNVSGKCWFSESKWIDLKSISHKYLPTFPKRLKKDTKLDIEFPYPIYSSKVQLNIDISWKPFETKSDTTRLNYYRKLYSKEKKKILVKDLKRTVVNIPNYVIDVAIGSIHEDFNEVWHYSGGLLDCVDINKSPFALYVSSPDTISCVDINERHLVSTFSVGNSLPIYNIKCSVNDNNSILGARQKSKILLFRPFTENFEKKSFWSKTSKRSFVDMQFNQYCIENFCTLDIDHNLRVEDITNNGTVLEYFFPTKDSNLIDHLANILLLDANTLVFMDRIGIYMLDLRSKSIRYKCVKDDLACDELCSIANKNTNSLYLSSQHNILEFDVNLLSCSNKVMHLMSTPPIISSLAKYNEEIYLSLVGQNDKVLMRTTDQLLSLPQYVPSIIDTMNAMCSTVKLENLNIMDERLTFPIVGMKLHTDPVTDDIFMLTCNTAGDVFKQRMLNDTSTFLDPVNALAKWTRKLTTTPRVLETTSLCNLNKLFHNVTNKFPPEKYIQYLMREGNAEEFFDTNVHSIEKDTKSKVGEVLNALWEDDPVAEVQDKTKSSQSKVMEWLLTNL